jgi:AcrR family transcriptional regulator
MPRGSRGEGRRKQIVDGALAAIRASSVADVQLAAIAEQAGMRANHVLYYFATRDEVLIAAAQQVELTLADGRAERLEAVEDPDERLRAYAQAYLPEDRHDPIWKLWLEGWLRSASHDGFAEVGDVAHAGWLADLDKTVQHALDHGGSLTEPVRPFSRRMIFVLDGLAVHVMGGHITHDEAIDLAMTTLRRELRLDTAD